MFVPRHSDDEDSMTTHERIRSSYGGSRLILAVGRLAARKGYGLLLRAFAKVHAAAPGAR